MLVESIKRVKKEYTNGGDSMNLVRRRPQKELWNPMREFENLQNEINRLFDFTRDDAGGGLLDGGFRPALDVRENDSEFIVSCDLPGVEKDEVDISISSNVLTIKGEKRSEEEEKNATVYRKESWAGTFQRTLSLPNIVDPDKIKAEMTNGVLTVRLPKKEEVKPRQIAVQVK
jgi:HSP20 family protein